MRACKARKRTQLSKYNLESMKFKKNNDTIMGFFLWLTLRLRLRFLHNSVVLNINLNYKNKYIHRFFYRYNFLKAQTTPYKNKNIFFLYGFHEKKLTTSPSQTPLLILLK